jgi:condensin complex subunit 3
MYLSVRQSLMDRTSDKESFVRSTAIIGLSKLLGSEDPSDPPAGPSISQIISYALCYDISPEVRKTALINLPIMANADYLPAILSRSRDVDPLVRRMLYGHVLSSKTVHPRALSISQRETLVKHGLGDREDAVRVSAGKLVASWYETVTTQDGTVIDFLKLFDVVGPEGAVAADALSSIFALVPDTLYGVKFDGELLHPIHS